VRRAARDKRVPAQRDPESDRLDGLVVNVELTLISIIQGVALYFLVSSSGDVLVSADLVYWPYVVTGFLFLIVFWSRAVLHVLTVIRWPLQFPHNFLYIAAVLLECILFTQLRNPSRWFVMGSATVASAWLVFRVDLGMVRVRSETSPGDASRQLYSILEREQLWNVRAGMPLLLGAWALAAVSVASFPGFHLESGGHLIWGVLHMAIAGAYLIYVLRFYRRISPLILAAGRERRSDEGPTDPDRR
jgi:hypothetical protein